MSKWAPDEARQKPKLHITQKTQTHLNGWEQMGDNGEFPNSELTDSSCHMILGNRKEKEVTNGQQGNSFLKS